MVATLFLEKEYKSVGADSITSISKDFKERFGLELPSHPMETVLKRMSKEGFLDKRTGEWKPVTEKLTELDITSISKEINRTFESLLECIKEFAETTFETLITNIDIENGLIAYLKKHFGNNPKTLLIQTKFINFSFLKITNDRTNPKTTNPTLEHRQYPSWEDGCR